MTIATRTSFGLSGPSIALDERTHAVRGDLADIALAGKLFVPHYARPMEMICTQETPLRAAADHFSDTYGMLSIGDVFMAVDMAGDWAWGFRSSDHIVGYVELSKLEQSR